MPKYLDMPKGNGESAAYRQFKSQIDRGRAVSVVRVLDESGNFSCFINSGDPLVGLTEETSLLHAIMLTADTRLKAEAAGHHPVEGYTDELVDMAA